MKVLVCGGFDPIRYGHISHMKEAKKLGDYLVVVVNSDKDMLRKKGYVFMSQEERIKIIKEFPFVDEVVLCVDDDDTVTKTLKQIKPQIFAKGGDRIPSNMPESELNACEEIGCKVVYDVGDRKDSSSQELVRNAAKQLVMNERI